MTLFGEDYTTLDHQERLYVANVCEPIGALSFGANEAFAALWDIDGQFLGSLARYDTSRVALKTTSVSWIEDGIALKYNNGDSWPHSNGQYIVTYDIHWDWQIGGGELHTAEEIRPCEFVLTFRSKHVWGIDRGNIFKENKNKAGLSLGTKFLMTLVIVFVVYLIAGAVAAYQKNPEDFVENFPPNQEFWRDLFGLVKEGWTFTLQQVKETAAKTARKVFKHSEYEDLTN